MIAEVRKLKQLSGHDLTVLGSGSIVSQLTQEGVIDSEILSIVTTAYGEVRNLLESHMDSFL